MPKPRKASAAPRPDAFEELSFYLGRAYYDHLQTIELLLAERGLQDHLGTGMGQILFRLFEQDGCIIKDLCQSLRMSPSRLSTVLVRMEGAGLIERVIDAGDKRSVRLRLTALGRSLEPDCRGVLRDINQILADGLGADEVERLKRGLDRMVNNLASYRRRTPTPTSQEHADVR